MEILVDAEMPEKKQHLAMRNKSEGKFYGSIRTKTDISISTIQQIAQNKEDASQSN